MFLKLMDILPLLHKIRRAFFIACLYYVMAYVMLITVYNHFLLLLTFG